MAEPILTSGKPIPSPSRTTPPDEHHHRGTHPILWIILLVIVVAPIAAFKLLPKKTPPRRVPLTTISTTNVAKGNIDVTQWALGTVTPIYTAMVSPRVDGQLIKVDYTEGQIVKTNDLLAEIDPAPYKALEEQAEGQLARDKALLEGAKVDLGRYQDAYTKKAIPKQQVDDEMALVHQDEGTVKFDEGQLATAKVQLAYCYIYAPIAGRTGLRMVDPGNVVHAANTNALVVITQLQPITVIFSPTEDILPAVQKQLNEGHEMTVEAWDHDQKQKLATGKFLTTDAQIDTGTGTIRMKAIFENKDMALFANQFVNVRLILETLTNVTLVPTETIQRNPQEAFVYTVNSQTVNVTNEAGNVTTTNQTSVKMHPITTGISEGDVTSIEGIAPGTTIAADNFNKLSDGTKVNVRQGGGAGRSKDGDSGNRKRHSDKTGTQDNPS
ncbi:MAG TPA: efflux RND transporter periplasmic adaptor subunit [Verrucomicrobiae bacterium]|jgi:multidrug efflux system membrane fusion protein